MRKLPFVLFWSLLALISCSSDSPAPGTVAVGDSCSSDLDCVVGAFCDLGVGGTDACEEDGTIAIGGACTDDRDCDPGDFCDGYTGDCVAGDPSLDGSIAIGAECTYDEECLTGDACDDTGHCVSDAYSNLSEDTGDACFEDADCSTDYCDQDTDTCV